MSYPLVSTMPPLGALATAPGSARAHLRNTLTDWRMSVYEEVAELLTSELVTNAVVASTGDPRFRTYLFHSGGGSVLLLLGLTLDAAGAAWMARLTRVQL